MGKGHRVERRHLVGSPKTDLGLNNISQNSVTNKSTAEENWPVRHVRFWRVCVHSRGWTGEPSSWKAGPSFKNKTCVRTPSGTRKRVFQRRTRIKARAPSRPLSLTIDVSKRDDPVFAVYVFCLAGGRGPLRLSGCTWAANKGRCILLSLSFSLIRDPHAVAVCCQFVLSLRFVFCCLSYVIKALS